MSAEIKKMTVDEFLALPEKEQIALVGSRVMGWTPGSGHFEGWNPLGDIAAAWEALRKMRSATCCITIQAYEENGVMMWAVGMGEAFVDGLESETLAICIAALKAVGVIE